MNSAISASFEKGAARFVISGVAGEGWGGPLLIVFGLCVPLQGDGMCEQCGGNQGDVEGQATLAVLLDHFALQ